MSANGVPPASIRPPGAALGDSSEAIREAAGEEFLGGARLLVSDGRMVYLLLNEARARAIARLFGISGPNSALVTIIALGLAGEMAHRKVVRLIRAPGAPELGEAALGASVLTQSVRWIAGPGTGDFPLFGPLVLFAVVGTAFRPVLRATVHGVRNSAHRAHTGLDHRYGHIIRRNRPRPATLG